MVQLYPEESKVLATFNADLNDILFGYPHIIREKETRTEYISMILHTTQNFPVEIYLKDLQYFTFFQIANQIITFQIIII